MRHSAPKDAAELEALENREWLESLDYVLQSGGPARVSRLLHELADHARSDGVKQPFSANTAYINTIPVIEEPPFPGSREIERRIKSLVRWNALAMVVRANKVDEGIGGHISTYASAAAITIDRPEGLTKLVLDKTTGRRGSQDDDPSPSDALRHADGIRGSVLRPEHARLQAEAEMTEPKCYTAASNSSDIQEVTKLGGLPSWLPFWYSSWPCY